MPGLLIAGREISIEGIVVLNANDHSWIKLAPQDYRMRKTQWVRAIVCHTTGGRWPQDVHPGAGVRGHAEQIAAMWSGADRGGGERISSGAHLVVDFDGTVYCLADLQYVCAYHATTVNDHTIGLEMCTLPDGGIYQATLDATVELCLAICDRMAIPFQVNASLYTGHPIPRLAAGGADAVGIYGHRDQSEQRGRGDPGDAIYVALGSAGAEPLDFAVGEDLATGRGRQTALNARDARAGNTFRPLVVDGQVGPASIATARRQGFANWADVPLQ